MAPLWDRLGTRLIFLLAGPSRMCNTSEIHCKLGSLLLFSNGRDSFHGGSLLYITAVEKQLSVCCTCTLLSLRATLAMGLAPGSCWHCVSSCHQVANPCWSGFSTNIGIQCGIGNKCDVREGMGGGGGRVGGSAGGGGSNATALAMDAWVTETTPVWKIGTTLPAHRPCRDPCTYRVRSFPAC